MNPNGDRPNRRTGDFGYWKTTQKDTTVYMYDDASGLEVGKKRGLVYYDASNKKSQWLMHEYTTIDPNIPVGSREDKMKVNMFSSDIGKLQIWYLRQLMIYLIATWKIKVSSRLSKWKIKTLSCGRRLTLIKSVLNALPLYYMPLYKAPAAVLNELESIRRNFFDGSIKEDRKMMLIRWENILASKSKGGLGVSSLYASNRALIFKWIWRLFTNCSLIWANLIKAIHGTKGKLDVPNSKINGSIWQELVREFLSLKAKGIDCFSFIKHKLRNGENTTFWDDLWLGDSVLKTSHPRIFALESRKNISVAEKMNSASLDASFCRKPRGGAEEEQFMNLVSITSHVLLPQTVDRWSWTLK
ncbi:RNA-directed DNA polymerase, eukaryota, reverse transcriptase zinc-binding domain protein, partial [Tanacetum coccineum]